MEGKYTRLVRENRVELGALVFFICCLIAGMALLIFIAPAPSGTAFAVHKRHGVFIITHRGQTYQIALPPFVITQPDSHATDFYTQDNECRLTVAENKKQAGIDVALWMQENNVDSQQLTFISEDVQWLNDEHTRMLYRVETFETGKTFIYYEDKDDHILEMRMFGNSESCYEAFESYMYNFSSLKK